MIITMIIKMEMSDDTEERKERFVMKMGNGGNVVMMMLEVRWMGDDDGVW